MCKKLQKVISRKDQYKVQANCTENMFTEEVLILGSINLLVLCNHKHMMVSEDAIIMMIAMVIVTIAFT